jgi:hypothetical protein
VKEDEEGGKVVSICKLGSGGYGGGDGNTWEIATILSVIVNMDNDNSFLSHKL